MCKTNIQNNSICAFGPLTQNCTVTKTQTDTKNVFYEEHMIIKCLYSNYYLEKNETRRSETKNKLVTMNKSAVFFI